MTSDIGQIKTKVYPVFKKFRVSKSAVFGSIARGEAKKNSDIDILVQLPADSSLLDLIALKIELEKKLGKNVDLLTYKSISPLLKATVLKDQIPLL